MEIRNSSVVGMRCVVFMSVGFLATLCLIGVESSNAMSVGHGYKLTSAVTDFKGNLFGQLRLIKKTEMYGPDIEELQLVVSGVTMSVGMETREFEGGRVVDNDWGSSPVLLSGGGVQHPVGDADPKQLFISKPNMGKYNEPEADAETICETEDTLHLSITDAHKTRWEVPQELLPRKEKTLISEKTSTASIANGGETEQPDSAHCHELQLSYTANPFGFSIKRISSGDVLFNTTDEGPNNLVFKDQFIQISTSIPQDASLYGLGESSRPGGFKLVKGDTYTFWNSDIPSSNPYLNLYGSHPFYMDVRQGGTAHGVLFLNSNGMDIDYTGDRLKYKTIGGIIDFYFISGPCPTSVIQQYTKLIGRPAPMPYWSFGFHQCRWGYKDVKDMESVVSGYREKGIPLDTIWNDIDYMEDFKDFTLDPINYPAAKLRSFLDQLHASGQRYVLIVDPGIKVEKGYDTFDNAVKEDIFIKQGGQPYLAQVWPGPVHFPDFLNPKTQQFWTKEISQFFETVPFDGLWIDMNEVSNFCSGITCSLPEDGTCPSKGKSLTDCCLICNSPHNSTQWEDPAYKIRNNGNHRHIRDKTITPSAVHHNAVLEYNAHNLYGLSETIVTHKTLQSITKKRPFILTRSTFVGSGAYAAHWTGDNAATWDDLRYSIPSILNFGLFGMPMIGADICGFLKDTTEELCNRWIQLGAFYPFSRQHSDNGTIRQELYLWDSVSVSAKRALTLRGGDVDPYH
ncbi:hypothetical protein KI387_028172, partial [Taxus chinensis]